MSNSTPYPDRERPDDESGNDLAAALDAFAAESSRPSERRQLNRLAASLRGAPEQWKHSKKPLSRTVAAGWWKTYESSGATEHPADKGLRDLVETIEHAAATIDERRWRRRRWAYPAVIFSIAFAVLCLLSFTVIPEFALVYNDFDLGLPAPTAWLVNIAALVRESPAGFLAASVLAFGVVMAAAWGFRWIAIGSGWFSTLATGSARQLRAMATVCELSARLRARGVSPSEILRTAARHCDHPLLRGCLHELSLIPEADRPASPPASRLSAMFVEAFSGKLDDSQASGLLDQLGRIYRNRARCRTESEGGWAVQLAIVALGLFVGFVVVAMFLPLVQLISGLT